MNDVFQTLLHASGTGRLTHFLFRATWSLTRHRRRRVPINGTLTVLITIGVWVALVAVGWALIYLPYIPEGFVYTGIDPDGYQPFPEAITISLVMLTTLGLGDTVPAAPLLRLLSPLEALAGFALLSASVSWFMQLYPALARRRAFAIELTSLHSRRTDGDRSRTSRLAKRARSCAPRRRRSPWSTADLVQNAEIFYFTDGDERLSAARAIGFVTTLRDAALASPHADVRAEGRQLSGILDELATRLRQQYSHVRGESADDILAAFAESHGYGWATGR